MNEKIIPEEAVDPVAAYLNAHFRSEVAADLLAAAQPLMAIAWDEGAHSGWLDDGAFAVKNPYRTAK